MYVPESLSLFEEALERVKLFEAIIIDIIKTDPVYVEAFDSSYYEGFLDGSADYRCTLYRRLPTNEPGLVIHYNEEIGPNEWEPQYIRIYGPLLERLMRALESRWREEHKDREEKQSES